MHNPWVIGLFVLTINMPFGYWRAGCRKLSFSWFAAIHVPILLSIGLRLFLGVAFRFSTVLLYVLAFAAGQFLGGGIRRQRQARL